MSDTHVLAQFAATPLKLKSTEQAAATTWSTTSKLTPMKRPLEENAQVSTLAASKRTIEQTSITSEGNASTLGQKETADDAQITISKPSTPPRQQDTSSVEASENAPAALAIPPKPNTRARRTTKPEYTQVTSPMATRRRTRSQTGSLPTPRPLMETPKSTRRSAKKTTSAVKQVEPTTDPLDNAHDVISSVPANPPDNPQHSIPNAPSDPPANAPTTIPVASNNPPSDPQLPIPAVPIDPLTNAQDPSLDVSNDPPSKASISTVSVPPAPTPSRLRSASRSTPAKSPKPQSKELSQQSKSPMLRASARKAKQNVPPTQPDATQESSADIVNQNVASLVASNTISGSIFAQCWKHLDSTRYAWQSIFTALVECETLCLHDHLKGKEPPPTTPLKSKVSFRCFDLSTLELQYVSERGTTQRIETILHHCEGIVRKLSKLDMTLMQAINTALSSIAEKKLASAVVYFHSVFQNPPEIMVGHISRLSTSLARHYLRVIFLYFDDRLSEDKSSTTTVSQPSHYAHQDLGAAIHRALDDRLLFSTMQTTQKERFYYATSVEFLYKALHMVNHTTKDAYLSSLVRKLQNLCSRLVQYVFLLAVWIYVVAYRCKCEDEAHLFPLGSFASFERTLKKELDAIDMKLVKSEYSIPRTPTKLLQLPEQESTPLKEKYRAGTACSECKQAWRDITSTVQCAACQRRYHLTCLYLSPTFRNLSGTYKCPHCL
ncbi:hypothetical protein AeMF1_019889 [Aphanomyces euteiches]|nr:hypothetical protein AeMF1_019889 [Aphanomyces euteiches]KAH9185818.1 hypothetical protein AeNC1_012207 [Aphanomyces euteiches]